MNGLSRRDLLLGSAGLGALSLLPGFGRAANATWPLWRRQLRAMRWCVVPASNRLIDIDPARNPAFNPNLATNPNTTSAPWSGNTHFTSIIVAWCGACYDQGQDVLWLPLGGGHADYAVNEAYSIRLADEAPTWRMPRPPSGSIPLGLITLNDGQEASGDYADGRPRATHSYNKHCYVPGFGPVCAVQGNVYRTSLAGTSRTLLLDESSGEWSTLATHPNPGKPYGGACYDSTRRLLFWVGMDGSWLTAFDPLSGTWQVREDGARSTESGYIALTHLPGHELIVQLSINISGGFAVWDTQTAQRTRPGTTNAKPAHLSDSGGKAGGVWVPSLNAIAMWQNRDVGSTGPISLLRAPTQPRDMPWTWDSLPLANTDVLPSVAVGNGTYGRFGYAPNLDGFYLLNGINEPVYFFALSDGEGLFANGFEDPV